MQALASKQNVVIAAIVGAEYMKIENLWAVNIPEEPDSELLHPVPTKKIGKQLVHRLKKEALQVFPTVGQSIADAITLEEWNGSQEDHTKYLQDNKNWWNDTTFLENDDVEAARGGNYD